MEYPGEECIIEWLRSGIEKEWSKKLTLSPAQVELKMTPVSLVLALCSFDNLVFCETISDQHQERFHHLQQLYHGDDNESLYVLSPRMELQEANQISQLRRSLCEFLIQKSEKALLELQEALQTEASEEYQLKVRLKKRREKKKLNKRKRAPQSGSTLLPRLESGESNNYFKEHQPSSRVTLDEKLQPLPMVDPTLLEVERGTEKSKDDDLFPNSPLRRRQYTESLQQVQLKAFIAETKLVAANERIDHLETFLRAVLADNCVCIELREDIENYLVQSSGK